MSHPLDATSPTGNRGKLNLGSATRAGIPLRRDEVKLSLKTAAGSDPEVVKLLRAIETEIGAGMVLVPKNDLERVYNQACERALSILRSYRRGEGLFQMTGKVKKP